MIEVDVRKKKVYAKCPDCGSLHLVRKQHSHLTKSPRFKCRECSCTWKPKPDEVERIKTIYDLNSDETTPNNNTQPEDKNKNQAGGRPRSIAEMLMGR